MEQGVDEDAVVLASPKSRKKKCAALTPTASPVKKAGRPRTPRHATRAASPSEAKRCTHTHTHTHTHNTHTQHIDCMLHTQIRTIT